MRDHALEIRLSLRDPVVVCSRLGLARGGKRQSGGVLICCPSHSEKTPSCSVTLGDDSTIRVRCFGCGLSGDVFNLVAAARALDVRGQFREVLLEAAQIGGLDVIADELRTGAEPAVPRQMPQNPPESIPKVYPPLPEVRAVWCNSVAVESIPDCARALAQRGLFPDSELARALDCEPEDLPRWCRYQGRGWLDLGYRVVLPAFDHLGEMRSLRAWRIGGDPSTPKRLPPSGMRGTGVVLANPAALRWLRAPGATLRIIIVEGESDFLSAAQRWPAAAIVGHFSGAWTQDFADRVPTGSEVVIMTDHDEAGNKYAADISKTLASRALVIRSR